MQKLLLQIFLALSLLQPLQLLASVPDQVDSSNLLNLDLRVFLAARPITFILVEKDQQRLRVLQHDGRLRVIAEYTAVTGENMGRKVVEGDEKTPEGVYFITKKYIDTKVTIFGTRAFHLNYPNVFDVRDGRGGNGIFIHGTNKPLRRYSTNGCITLNNRDLDEVADYLDIGRVPVIIVESLKMNVGEFAVDSYIPNLADGNFAVAKQMLLPDYAPRDAEFVSIYTLRVNNQVILAGEYKGLGGSLRSYAAGYYDANNGADLAVLDMIAPSKTVKDARPNLPTTVASSLVSIDGNLPSVNNPGTSLFNFGQIWRPKQEDVYLTWYRESLRANPQIKAAIAQQPTSSGEGYSDKLLYGLFILASCVSIGSALFFIRSQMRRVENTTGVDGLECIVLEKGMNAAPLRKDLQKVKETLQMMQEHVQKEASLMDSEVQARIDDLEKCLAEKQGEIEQLSAEKAALRLKGMSHMSGQIEELGQIKQDLKSAEKKLEDAREDLGKLPVLEDMLAVQKEEIQQLNLEKATMRMEMHVGAAGQDSELEALREQVAKLQGQLAAQEDSLNGQAAADSQKSAELSKELEVAQVNLQNVRQELQSATEEKSILAAKLSKIDELKVELRLSRSEVEQLSFDNELFKKQADSSDIVQKLEQLQRQLTEAHADLQVSQSRNANLALQMADRDRLQQELDAKKLEIEDLHTATAALEIAADTSDVEAKLNDTLVELAAGEEELSRQQSANRDLLDQLQANGKIEAELAQRSAELEVLSEENRLLQESADRDLAVQLQSTDKLATELAERAVDIEHLVAENKALLQKLEQSDLKAELAEVKDELAAAHNHLRSANEQNSALADVNTRLREVEELVLARQVEVTSMKNALVAQKEMAEKTLAESRKELLAQVDDLRQELAEAQDAHAAVVFVEDAETPEVTAFAVVEDEIAAAPVVDADPEAAALEFESESAVSEEVAVSEKPEMPVVEKPVSSTNASVAHGTKFLPGDILDKWMTG